MQLVQKGLQLVQLLVPLNFHIRARGDLCESEINTTSVPLAESTVVLQKLPQLNEWICQGTDIREELGKPSRGLAGVLVVDFLLWKGDDSSFPDTGDTRPNMKKYIPSVSIPLHPLWHPQHRQFWKSLLWVNDRFYTAEGRRTSQPVVEPNKIRFAPWTTHFHWSRVNHRPQNIIFPNTSL